MASIEVEDTLRVGDFVHIRGHITDFDQTIESMQVRREEIPGASRGMIVGIKVSNYVRKNDEIYRIID